LQLEDAKLSECLVVFGRETQDDFRHAIAIEILESDLHCTGGTVKTIGNMHGYPGTLVEHVERGLLEADVQLIVGTVAIEVVG
jgi:hypothetical protein